MDLKYDLWLHNLKISNKMKNRLVDCFRSSYNVYMASKEMLISSNLLSIEEIETLLSEKSTIEYIEDKYINDEMNYICRTNDGFPQKLKEINNSPFGLYYKGKIPEDFSKCVAIVGARKCSEYGKWAAEEISYQLALRGYIIVSGMALGIDDKAHLGALRANGVTVAVLGSGVDVCYPRSNIETYMNIQKNGCIISEYPKGTKPVSYNFPLRNRIISALCNQVIVIEANEKSGSLITVDYALEQGKDIYALPGRITDNVSCGCNKLIYQGAEMIYSIEEFVNGLSDLQYNTILTEKNTNCQNFLLEKEDLLVYSCLSLYPKSIDEIENETKLELWQILSSIMDLCSYGLIKETFINQYIRIK